MKEAGLLQKDGWWKAADLKRLWNFELPYDRLFTHDTIGAAVLDRKGVYATASSTGGASPMLLGRVGDTPMVGSGFYAGPKGAVAATGIGEEIIRRMLARAVYDMIERGRDPNAACERGLSLFPADVPVGLIAIGRHGGCICANRRMAAYRLIAER